MGIEEKAINSFLENLKKMDTGTRATLKRSTGRRIQDAKPKSLVAYYKLIQPIDFPEKKHIEQNEDEYFIISCLFSLKKDRKEAEGKNVGQALKEAKVTESLDKRFNALVEAAKGSSEFARKLSNMIKYLDSKEVKMDWKQLTIDVLMFNSRTQNVKRKWARNYYA